MNYRNEVVNNPIFLHLSQELAAAYRELDRQRIEIELYKEHIGNEEAMIGQLETENRRLERLNFGLHGKVFNLQVTIGRLIRSTGRELPNTLVRRALLFASDTESEPETDVMSDGREVIDLTASDEEMF